MTFQPPPGDTPPPPPPGQWNPPPAAGHHAPRTGFDPKTVNNLDWAVVGLGGLLLIFSFFSYYSLDLGPYGSDSTGAWHFSNGSFIAWFAMVFAVLGCAAVAVELFAPQVQLPQPNRVLSVELLGAGSVLYLLAIFVHPKFYDEHGLSFGHGFSFWLSLIMAIAATVLSLMRLQQVGGRLPGALGNLPNIGGAQSSR